MKIMRVDRKKTTTKNASLAVRPDGVTKFEIYKPYQNF